MGRMPKPNEAMKDFFKDNEVYADAFNAVYFEGEEFFKAGDLSEGDTAYENSILVRNARVMAEVGKLAALEKNGQTVTLQVKGMVYPDDKVVIFDFVEAVENVAKPRAGRRGSKKKDL
jgi:hypothetical protein